MTTWLYRLGLSRRPGARMNTNALGLAISLGVHALLALVVFALTLTVVTPTRFTRLQHERITLVDPPSATDLADGSTPGLPGAPTPDGKLLPPSLVRHYRKAVAAPREQTTCQLDASVRAEDLLVDGKGPTLRGGALDVPAGTHYVVLRGRCPAGATGCVAGARSMRLEARGMGCRVRRPSALGTQRTSDMLICEPKPAARRSA